MYVCICRAVTEHEVRSVVERGAKTVEAVTQTCCAGDDCGACRDAIEDMIEERWGAKSDGAVHLPVVIAHSREDTLIPYSHALKLFAAANEPKHLITFDTPTDDGFGGHVDALFKHVDVLRAALVELVPGLPAPPEQ